MTGLILVDKPQGPTSHDIIAGLRRSLKVRKAGHCGTLDPMATGLLLVLTGRATRLAEIFREHDKVYRGTVAFGTATDSDDREGREIARLDDFTLDDAALTDALAELAAARTQRPPAISAIKVGGVPHYRLMRGDAGERPDLPERPVRIHRLELLQRDEREITIEVHCGTGTYIRALARDLGQKLGIPAHLSALRRLRSGPFGVEQAMSIEAIAAAERPGLSIDEALAWLPAARVREQYLQPIKHGAQPGAGDLEWEGPLPDVGVWVRLLAPEGHLLALARVEGTPEPALRLRRSLAV